MTDYSSDGISAVLSQNFSDGEHPVAYWSKANKQAQRNYQATIGECYAAIQGIKHFRSYLPQSMIRKVLELGHEEAGHYGPWKTLELLKERCWWENMSTEVTAHCKNCAICQKTRVGVPNRTVNLLFQLSRKYHRLLNWSMS